MSREKILICDDEIEIAELIKDYLDAEGYETMIVADGDECISKFHQFKPDFLVLDIMLPGLDGMEVCRKLRAESDIPILMVSAKKSDLDKVLGLGLGADDYVTKPFSPAELVARVKSHIRRYAGMKGKRDGGSVLKYGCLEIDAKSYQVIVSGKQVNLSAKEFELLQFLAGNPSQVFTREQIFDNVWGVEEFGDINTVTVHIRKIREKIEFDPSNPEFIKTVWGVGYKFDGENR